MKSKNYYSDLGDFEKKSQIHLKCVDIKLIKGSRMLKKVKFFKDILILEEDNFDLTTTDVYDILA